MFHSVRNMDHGAREKMPFIKHLKKTRRNYKFALRLLRARFLAGA